MGPCAEGFALGRKESVLMPLDQSCGHCGGQRATLIAVPLTCRGLRETRFIHLGDPKVRIQEVLRLQGGSWRWGILAGIYKHARPSSPHTCFF